MDDKIYVGSGKEMVRDGKEPYYRVQVELTEIKAKAMEHVKKVQFRDGEHTLINLVLAPMKHENRKEYRTHSLKVDTWKPDPNYRKPEPVKEPDQTPPQDNPDDLPF